MIAPMLEDGPAPEALRAPDAPTINLLWLLRLRRWAVLGQLLVILGARELLAVMLPLVPLLTLVGFSALVSLAGTVHVARSRPVRAWMVTALTLLDVVLLTGLLYLSGGPYNSFSFLYLVHIALAVLVLELRWAWAVVALSLVCFGGLFVDHVPLIVDGADERTLQALHLRGTWVALAVAAVFIVYFVERVTRALASREAQLAAFQKLTARNERLASLATLSAGAAHELSTPLSTIAVVAKELERGLSDAMSKEDAIADARLIREQVQRCRGILDLMAADAGQDKGESIVVVDAPALVEVALDGLPERHRIKVSVDPGLAAQVARVPVRALGQSLRAVLKNALDASPPGAEVELAVRPAGTHWRLEIADRGPGMAPDVLARVGEPFFTTKEPGRGMGLGMFLARAVLERLGGSLELTSAAGVGTRAILCLPAGPADAV